MNTEEKLETGKIAEAKSTAEVAKSTISPAESEAMRKQRIDDFQRGALADPDALQANLGAINGGLMRMSHHMEKAIEEALTTIEDPIDRFERLGPSIDTFLKLTRQIDRLAQLDRRLSS